MGDLLRRILEERQGQFVSGQEIGNRLGVSRAAVWKRVESLRSRGFGIEGARGAGYRLVSSPDVIDESELLARLVRPTFWKSFLVYSATDSTNSRAVEQAEKGAPDGTVVCADAQSSGRGRFGRRWESPPGLNLYLSMLLRPPIEPHLAPQLTLVTAIALAKAVESAAGIPTGLKWPNDLYLGGRKAAGILAEMSADQDRLRHVVIGAGLNVNADSVDFPEELRDKATSLRISAGRSFRRVEVLALFLDAFADCFDQFLSGGFEALHHEWSSRSFLDGKRVVLRHRDEDVEGTVMGVDENGALLFRRHGAVRAERLHSGEIVTFAR